MTLVGFISNIHSVAPHYSWLHWVCKIPALIVELVQGFGSTVLLLVLFMLVPIILRILARLEGIPQKTGVELSLMDRFFTFQVIVGAFCVTPNQVFYNVSERLSGCHIRIWYYHSSTRVSEQPWISPVTLGSQFTKRFHVLSDVSVHLELTWQYLDSGQFCNSSRSNRNSWRLPSSRAFGDVLCQINRLCLHPTLRVRDQVLPPHIRMGHSLPCDDSIGCHHVGLFHHIPDHQWSRLCSLLFVLLPIQVSIYLGQ